MLNTYITIGEVSEVLLTAGIAPSYATYVVVVDTGETDKAEVLWFATRSEADEAITAVKLNAGEQAHVVVREVAA